MQESASSAVSHADGDPVLGVRSLRKAFGGALAVDGVSFDIQAGSIHALLGGNGSGKSTTIKILAGVVAADGGSIIAGGQHFDAEAQTAERAREMGLRFVHQQNSTFGDLTVAENLALGTGFETGVAGRISWRRQREHAASVLSTLGLNISPDARVDSLGSAVQMMVAIGRALQDQVGAASGVLVLDEPTASLPKSEVDLLLDFLVSRAEAGQGIILVTHRLNEVLRVAHRATVLRDGRVAAELERADMSHDSLVEAIMGQSLASLAVAERAEHVSRVAELAGQPEVLRLHGDGDGGLDISVRAGECLGLAGLLGSGRSSLLRRIFGTLPRDAELLVGGTAVQAENPGAAMSAGIAYVPEDRVRDALFPDLSIARNLSVTRLPETSRAGVVDGRTERSRARNLIGEFGVKAASEVQPIGSLSGGNQQKVILARWMQREPAVLLLDEPTQGVDVGARAEIHRLVRDACARGMAVIVVSSEFDELVALCDRVLLVHRGRAVDEVVGPEISEDVLNARVFAKEAISQ